MTTSQRRSARFIGLALAALVLGTTSADAQDLGIAVGADAPAATVETMAGSAIDLSRYYGSKPVVLEFWATWCPVCRKLEPAMQAARDKHAGAVTFVSVGVAANQTAARQKAHAEKEHMTGELVFDRMGEATKAFIVPHTSYVVVISRSGKVVYTGVGADQDVEAAVQKALR